MNSSAKSHFVSIAVFYSLKIVVGLALMILSTRFLDLSRFSVFTQLLLFSAWVNLIATGGAVNGLIRQAAYHHSDIEQRRKSVSSALILWLGTSAAIMVIAVVCKDALSRLLIGTEALSPLILPITALAVPAGAAQLMCAILTGDRRTAASMTAQSAGLIASGAGAVAGLIGGMPNLAVLLFSAGPLVTLCWAMLSLRREIAAFRFCPTWADIRLMLSHAASFFGIAALPPLMLFVARSAYQEHFSLAALALWLTAQRISDINTQAVSLLNTQHLLPHLTSAAERDKPRIFWTGTMVATGLGLASLAGFLVLGKLFMNLLFPPEYLAAFGIVCAYLLGDSFRAIVNSGMMLALSNNRLAAYGTIEVAIFAVISAGVVALSSLGVKAAPILVYPIVYAIAAVITLIVARSALRSRAVASA